jgi:hypothetical protein
VIKFVSDLKQVGGFLTGTPVSSTNKTEILLKVALNTITLTPIVVVPCGMGWINYCWEDEVSSISVI